MASKKKGSSLSIGWVFSIVMIGILGVAVWGIINRASSADELKPGLATHPHVFSYSADESTVWLGTHTGGYEYNNGKWLRTLQPLQSNDVMGLEIDPTNPEKMIVSGHGFVKRSLDGGKTWDVAEDGLPNKQKPNEPDAHLLAMDTNNPEHLFTLLAGPGDNLYESNNGGNTWTKVGVIPQAAYSIAIAPGQSSSIIAGTESGLYRYDIMDNNIKETKIGNEPTFQIFITPTGEIITMNESGFQRSNDLTTWKPMLVDLNGEMPLGIKGSKKDANRLLIVTERYSVYESKDGGESWAKTK